MCNCNWGICVASSNRRPRVRNKTVISLYPGVRRQTNKMFSIGDKKSSCWLQQLQFCQQPVLCSRCDGRESPDSSTCPQHVMIMSTANSFHGPQNFEPSHRMWLLPQNFPLFTEFHGIVCCIVVNIATVTNSRFTESYIVQLSSVIHVCQWLSSISYQLLSLSHVQ